MVMDIGSGIRVVLDGSGKKAEHATRCDKHTVPVALNCYVIHAHLGSDTKLEPVRSMVLKHVAVDRGLRVTHTYTLVECHFTAVLGLLLTVATNCCAPAPATVTEFGVTATAIDGGPPWLPPPHAVRAGIASNTNTSGAARTAVAFILNPPFHKG